MDIMPSLFGQKELNDNSESEELPSSGDDSDHEVKQGIQANIIKLKGKLAHLKDRVETPKTMKQIKMTEKKIIDLSSKVQEKVVVEVDFKEDEQLQFEDDVYSLTIAANMTKTISPTMLNYCLK